MPRRGASSNISRFCTNEDLPLPDKKRLPILYIDDNPAEAKIIKKNALIWAAKEFPDGDAKTLFLNGIAAALNFGFICHVNNTPDGDWKKVINYEPLKDVSTKAIKKIINLANMIKAANVIIATKLNWWIMNHHIGHRRLTGNVDKILSSMYPEGVSSDIITAALLIGHYSSTRRILHLAGITGILPVQHVMQIVLCRCLYIKYCPQPMDFLALPALRAEVLANKASYHNQALYLTGKAKAIYSLDEDIPVEKTISDDELLQLRTAFQIPHKK